MGRGRLSVFYLLYSVLTTHLELMDLRVLPGEPSSHGQEK